MRATRFADVVIAGAAAFFALLLGLSVIRDTWVVYTILSPLIAAALIASLKLRGTVKIKLALVLVSTGLTLLAAEAVLTVASSASVKSSRAEAARRANIFFDSRDPSQLVEDLRSQGVDAFQSMNARNVLSKELVLASNDIFPLANVANRSVVLCNETGEFLVIETDEHGFHNPKGIWGRERIDVITIRDSFVQGWCVDPDRNISGLLRDVYPNTLNLGLESLGPAIELAIIREYGSVLKPGTVLWFYFEANDLQGMEFELTFPVVKNYLDADYRQDLVEKQEQIDRALTDAWNRMSATESSTNWYWVVNRFTLLLLRQKVDAFRCPGWSMSPETFSNFERILIEAKRHVESWGGELHFVYLPAWQRYSGPVSRCQRRRNDTNINLHDRVLSLVEKIGLPATDVTEAFDRHPDPLSLFPFRLPPHYNEEGYRLVVDEVLRSIDANRNKTEYTRWAARRARPPGSSFHRLRQIVMYH